MKTVRRAHVLLPQEIVVEIDAMVGPRKRSAFLVETARAEIRRRKLLQALESSEPAWKDSAHPELAKGADAWVRQMRREGQTRYAKIERDTRNPKAHPARKK